MRGTLILVSAAVAAVVVFTAAVSFLGIRGDGQPTVTKDGSQVAQNASSESGAPKLPKPAAPLLWLVPKTKDVPLAVQINIRDYGSLMQVARRLDILRAKSVQGPFAKVFTVFTADHVYLDWLYPPYPSTLYYRVVPLDDVGNRGPASDVSAVSLTTLR